MSDINPLKPEFAFDFRSILTAPAKAFELKKIFCGGVSLIAAWVVYLGFTYLAAWIDGLSVEYFFGDFGFFPLEHIRFTKIVSKIIYYLGMAGALLVVALGLLSVSLLTVEDLRGNRLCSAGVGIRFALGRFRQSVLAWVTIVVFVAFLSAMLALLGALLRIPIVGNELFALLTVIPGFLFGLVLTFMMYVFVCSFVVLPVATAVDRVGETFTSLLETFSTVMRQPFRWLGYTSVSLVSAKVCMWILAVFSVLALKLFTKLGSALGGSAAHETFRAGSGLLPIKSGLVDFTVSLWPGLSQVWGVPLSINISEWGKGGDATVAGVIMALALISVFAYVWGYGLSVIATAQTYAYVIIRKFRDGYDVTAEDPLFIEREWINPPISDTEHRTGATNSESS